MKTLQHQQTATNETVIVIRTKLEAMERSDERGRQGINVWGPAALNVALVLIATFLASWLTKQFK